jgi:hypothetical protein
LALEDEGPTTRSWLLEEEMGRKGGIGNYLAIHDTLLIISLPRSAAVTRPLSNGEERIQTIPVRFRRFVFQPCPIRNPSWALPTASTLAKRSCPAWPLAWSGSSARGSTAASNRNPLPPPPPFTLSFSCSTCALSTLFIFPVWKFIPFPSLFVSSIFLQRPSQPPPSPRSHPGRGEAQEDGTPSVINAGRGWR